MIVKVCFGSTDNKHTHTRIVECDDMHIKDEISERTSRPFTKILCYRAGAVVAELDAGVGWPDHLYIMDNGNTVDHMTFYVRDKETT